MTVDEEWYGDPFFESPDGESIDGGTTSHGPLWHLVTPRWGHSMHTMCSYHGMFPAKLVHYFLQRYSRPGDLVIDPFSGRGTTPLQARTEGRRVVGNDLNPLAYVLTRAKANPASWTQMQSLVDALERSYKKQTRSRADVPDDIEMLFHENTLDQLVFLRTRLLRKGMRAWTPQEFMLAGAIAGILHGLHRSDGTSAYLSISMPNTFSMSPAYVRTYIREKGLVRLDQDVFDCLRDKFARLYLDAIEGAAGDVLRKDANRLLTSKAIRAGTVDLVVTSPPYLRVVNYGTSNWIRLWWLGLDDVGRQRGSGRQTLDADLDHQHKYEPYREFILKMLRGLRRVMKKNGVAAVVIGDVATPEGPSWALASRLWEDIGDQTGLRLLELIEDSLAARNKVSRIWGETRGRATDRDCVLVLARDDGEPRVDEPDIDWEEPYKDGGPDAAHDRLSKRRVGLQTH